MANGGDAMATGTEPGPTPIRHSNPALVGEVTDPVELAVGRAGDTDGYLSEVWVEDDN